MQVTLPLCFSKEARFLAGFLRQLLV